MNTEIVGAGSIALYVAIGALVGGASILVALGVLAKQILQSPVLIAGLRHLANSASPELLDSLRPVAQLADEVLNHDDLTTPPTNAG